MTWSFPRNHDGHDEAFGKLGVVNKIPPHIINLPDSLTKDEIKIGIACSGGADSTFLSYLISSQVNSSKSNIYLLHFNHKTRGEESDIDEDFVSELAKHLGFKFVTQRTNSTIISDEARLREERINFLLRSGKNLHLNCLFLGHHADDVAETMLWRLPRSSTLEGIISPRPVVNHKGLVFIRPLLDIGREQIHHTLRELDIPWREDSSNQSQQYLRNRLRLNVMPQWKACIDRELIKGLSKTRNLLEQDMDAIQYYTELACIECKRGDSLCLDKFNSLQVAIRRRVLRKWLNQMHRQKFSFNGREDELLDQLKKKNLTNSDISGEIRINLKNNCITYSKINRTLDYYPVAYLPKDQSLYLPSGKIVKSSKIHIDKVTTAKILHKEVDPLKEAFLTNTEGTIFVRSKQDGDRYQPLGMKSPKKVGKMMTDKKWSKERKKKTPMFLNKKGEIIWIPGFPPHDSLKVDDNSERVIHLTYD